MRRKELELSVERELPGSAELPPARARLSAKFALPDDGPAPSAAELAEALEGLRRDLERAAGPTSGDAPVAPRRDRALPELIDTYRPRQAELVELLFEEGELTAEEHRLLTDHLARTGAAPASPAVPRGHRADPGGSEPSPAPPAAPIAAAPLATEHGPGRDRPVAELLATFQITSLKQAGAVRARRQISFEEYMALKRHFAPGGAVGSSPAAAPPS